MAPTLPSGGPIPSRPGNLPGGDPRAPRGQTNGPNLANGNITPQIVVEIAGDPKGKRPDIKNFTLRADVQQLYDPFQFIIADPEGELLWIADALMDRELIPIRIYHKDPFVNNNVERPWVRGVISRASITSGLQGSQIQISGYDLGYLLTSCAPIGLEYNLYNLQWPELVQKLINTTWLKPHVTADSPGLGINEYGLGTIIFASISRQVRQGRLDALALSVRSLDNAPIRRKQRQEIEIDNQLNIFAPTPRMLTQPGESVADILVRFAKLDGRLVNVSPYGDLEFFQPDYATAPQFIANYNRSSNQASLNNMEDGTRDIDVDGLYSRVFCYGSYLFPQAFYERDDPYEGVYEGVADHYEDGKQYFARDLTFSDNERYTQERANGRAEWRYQQGIFNADTVTFIAQGHSQNGIAFAPNSRIEVRSDKLAVNETRYISAVEYHQEERDDGIASYTRLVCKKDKVLAA